MDLTIYRTDKDGLSTCPLCGKKFIRPARPIYKVDVQGKPYVFCSYTCYRAVQKEVEARRGSQIHIERK